jgi:histidyl-tRNA synthetase
MVKCVRGTRDILPQDSYSWQEIEEVARRFLSFYSYQEIRTPILEEASLFNRSLGETTEIVQKQMFMVQHGKDHLVLRPEGTASVVRAYLENNLDRKKAISKFYYFGPMFRAERPQKGRLRQFHHLGVEAIGSLSPYLDVEVISLSARLLKELGINDYQICLNSLGCSKDKVKLARQLRSKLKGKLSKLCSDCQKRLKRNIFRILDCKNSACQKAVAELELKHDYLCPECQNHFQKVIDGLNSISLSYCLSPLLVRGLDYYTRTVFEIKHCRLGAQDALGAGGRYDDLVKQLGGGDCPAIGFAFGIERVLLIKEEKLPKSITQKKLIYIITLDEKTQQRAVGLLHNLRSNRFLADTDYIERSLKAKMRQANDLGARYCIIIGEDELLKGTVSLKDMTSGEQKEISEKDLLNHLLSQNLQLNP